MRWRVLIENNECNFKQHVQAESGYEAVSIAMNMSRETLTKIFKGKPVTIQAIPLPKANPTIRIYNNNR